MPEAAHDSLAVVDALAAAATAARSGVEATASMPAARGRAKYAGDKAVGVPDAGATTVAIILETWADTVAERNVS